MEPLDKTICHTTQARIVSDAEFWSIVKDQTPKLDALPSKSPLKLFKITKKSQEPVQLVGTADLELERKRNVVGKRKVSGSPKKILLPRPSSPMSASRIGGSFVSTNVTETKPLKGKSDELFETVLKPTAKVEKSVIPRLDLSGVSAPTQCDMRKIFPQIKNSKSWPLPQELDNQAPVEPKVWSGNGAPSNSRGFFMVKGPVVQQSQIPAEQKEFSKGMMSFEFSPQKSKTNFARNRLVSKSVGVNVAIFFSQLEKSADNQAFKLGKDSTIKEDSASPARLQRFKIRKLSSSHSTDSPVASTLIPNRRLADLISPNYRV